MKKVLLIAILTCLADIQLSAHDIELDGIYYNFNSDGASVSVTYKGSSYTSAVYSGEVNIPASIEYEGKSYVVSSIDKYAFYNCSGLTSVTIPNSVTSIGGSAFMDCSGLTSVTIPNSVTSIGGSAFMDCSGLASVTIPNSVTSISDNAFYYCSGLTSVTIPNGVTSIGGSAFMWCINLTSITIPNSVTSISRDTFNGCISLTSVTIPNSVTSIGSSAFGGCSSLTSVVIPNSVTSIGSSAFGGCSSLTSVVIPNSVTSIGAWAFNGCYSLTSATIGNSVTSIGGWAFDGCSSLTSATIGNSVTSIGYAAFENCSSITAIHISDLVAWCGISFENRSANPLYYARHLYVNGEEVRDLVVPNSVTSISNYAFQSCSGLTSVTIPNSVTSIGSSAFDGCSGLTFVSIPNSVQTLGEGAFKDCTNLETISLGEDISSVRPNTFNGCTNIKEVISHIKEPLNMVKNAFADNVYETAKLVVPDGTMNKYLACDGWKDFVNIVEESQQEAFMLTVSCNEGGEVTFEGQAVRDGSGRMSVKRNQSIMLTITPDEGYEIGLVTVNGIDVTADLYVNTYMLAQVKENKDVQVTFAEKATYLSIQQAVGGCVKQRVERGKTYEYRFEAESGWRIHSVTFNDADVTSKLNGNNTFTTPAIEENSTLIVAYEKVGSQATALHRQTDSQVSIAGTSHGVRVSNVEANDIIQVYSTDGKLVKAVRADSPQMDIPLDRNHVYIIKVHAKELKLRI